MIDDEDIRITSELAGVHTPEPWRLNPKNPYQVIAGDPEQPYTVANCWSGPFAPTREIARENARLIALAVNCHEELLAACELALEQIRHCDCSNGVTSPMGDQDEGNYWAEKTLDQLHAVISKAKGIIP